MSVEYETEVWQKSSFPRHSVTTIGTAWPTQLPEVTEQFKELEEEARRRPIGGNFSTRVCQIILTPLGLKKLLRPRLI